MRAAMERMMTRVCMMVTDEMEEVGPFTGYEGMMLVFMRAWCIVFSLMGRGNISASQSARLTSY